MIEIFKTNVKDESKAEQLITKIHTHFSDCAANFDLENCDSILRVECKSGVIGVSDLISLLNQYGFSAEVLPE